MQWKQLALVTQMSFMMLETLITLMSWLMCPGKQLVGQTCTRVVERVG